MLPPIVTFPVTSKLPVILVSFSKLIALPPNGLILISPVKDIKSFPASLKLPVCICVGSTIVVLGPSVNVIPLKD